MNKKLFSILAVFLLSSLITSTASAGGAVKLSGATFSLGSLAANGTFTGLGGYIQGVTVELVATGFPVVTCTNPNGNQAPGQNLPQLSANGEQIVGPQDITQKGTALLNVRAEPGPITGTQGGCPNDNWTAQIDFVFWTNAAISVRDTATGALLLKQDFNCTTTRDPDSVSCTAVP
jgi:hypothetical protein